jgi:hypothetical protein
MEQKWTMWLFIIQKDQDQPENVAIKEFDSSKIRVQCETIDIQEEVDYITITFLSNIASIIVIIEVCKFQNR